MTPRPELAPLSLPPTASRLSGSPPSSTSPFHTPSQTLFPTPWVPLRTPSPIRRPSHPSPTDAQDHSGRMTRSAEATAGLGLNMDLRALGESLPLAQPRPQTPSRAMTPPFVSNPTAPQSPPHTPPVPVGSAWSRSPRPFFDEHFGRRGSLPLASSLDPGTEPKQAIPASTLPHSSDTPSVPTPVVPLDALRALAAAGGDFAHFPGVSFHPHPTGGGGKHTVIHRTVPGGVFGPDLAARLVAHLSAESLMSPWLSPRPSPSLLPLALAPDDEINLHALDLNFNSNANGDELAPLSCTHSRSGSTTLSMSSVPKTPGRVSAAPPRTPPPLSLPLALTSTASPSPRQMPEAWWGGAPSVRAAAWAALMDDEVDVSSSRIVWFTNGGFGITREGATSPIVSPATARSSFDWSVLSGPANNAFNAGAKGTPTNTFAFLPPFNEVEADTLRFVLRARSPSSERGVSRSPSRAGRSMAPSPDTNPRDLSPTASESSVSSIPTREAGLLSAPSSLSKTVVPVTATAATNTTVGFHPANGAAKAVSSSSVGTSDGNDAMPEPQSTSKAKSESKAPPVARVPAPPRSTTPPPQARRNTLSLFGLSPRKPRK